MRLKQGNQHTIFRQRRDASWCTGVTYKSGVHLCWKSRERVKSVWGGGWGVAVESNAVCMVWNVGGGRYPIISHMSGSAALASVLDLAFEVLLLSQIEGAPRLWRCKTVYHFPALNLNSGWSSHPCSPHRVFPKKKQTAADTRSGISSSIVLRICFQQPSVS